MTATGIDVTVVVTTRNRLAMLPDAIASVRCQQGVGWELIVADDGSTDGTPHWLETELEPPRERLLAGAAAGRPRSANAALAAARGRYALVLDDDDELLPGALATLATELDGTPRATAAIGARLRAVDGATRRINHPARRIVHDASLELIASWGPVPGQVLMRTSAARRAGGYPESAWPADDLGMFLGLTSLGPFVLVPDEVLRYRVHPGQHTKPPDLPAIRQRLAAGALQRLPPARRRAAVAAWAAGRRRERADRALDSGRSGRALALYVAAACTAPAVTRSPLMWPLLGRSVLRSGLRLIERG